MAQGKITIEDTNEMIEVVGKLTREGLVYEVEKTSCGWVITITG